MTVPPGEKQEKGGGQSPWALAFRIVSDFGVTIAVPAVLLSWLGNKAELHFYTRPVFIIGGFFLAMLLSGFLVYRKAKKYADLYQKM
mgnify:CR=1 FL=1